VAEPPLPPTPCRISLHGRLVAVVCVDNAEPVAVAPIRQHLPGPQGQPLRLTWGDNSVSSDRSYSRAEGPCNNLGAFPINYMASSLFKAPPCRRTR
jgi:hypothetical protein